MRTRLSKRPFSKLPFRFSLKKKSAEINCLRPETVWWGGGSSMRRALGSKSWFVELVPLKARETELLIWII